MEKRLTKSAQRKLCGVCGGIAEYLNCDATLVRLATILLSCFCGGGIIAYIIAAIVMPNE